MYSHVWAFVIAGIASYYDLPGSRMADGHIFRPQDHVCAMRYEPLGERVRIVNSDNGREASCTVEDRGPFYPGRVIDVSPIVRDELGFTGLANVRVYRVVR